MLNLAGDEVGYPIAKIHIPPQGIVEKFIGYTRVDELHPAILQNTLVHVEGDRHFKLYETQDEHVYAEVHGPFTGRVMKYDPSNDLDLELKILTGEYAGKSGWTFAFGDLVAEDKLIVDTFSNAYLFKNGPPLR